MTYGSNRRFCDADSHIMETVDWVERHADPDVRAKLPQLSLVKSATASFVDPRVTALVVRFHSRTP